MVSQLWEFLLALLIVAGCFLVVAFIVVITYAILKTIKEKK